MSRFGASLETLGLYESKLQTPESVRRLENGTIPPSLSPPPSLPPPAHSLSQKRLREALSWLRTALILLLTRATRRTIPPNRLHLACTPPTASSNSPSSIRTPRHTTPQTHAGPLRMVVGDCLVCGNRTSKRCKSCSEQAGINLFFCSPEHQKLVWLGHRSFCGLKAFPVIFPLLSKDEACDIIPRLDIAPQGEAEQRSSFLKFAQTHIQPNMTRQELATSIWCITETGEKQADDAMANVKINQALLCKARISASPYINDKPLKDLIVRLVTLFFVDCASAELLPTVSYTFDKRQAELFHRLVAFVTFTSVTLQSSCKPGAKMTSLVEQYIAPQAACETALYAFACKTFGQDFADKLGQTVVSWLARFDVEVHDS
ncbi:hypothetical protein AAT19DRAFT_16336 [Rhodotorula toruloides]|uniref:MYND-type domain-containing protein n=1 Tax=Rhodotorula toruloides TaxID=5286 RepID=A0A2T0A325_RHOTO|nr:hypothetical protein AAT19DRAFT_16336 [Rhodotorula toruloides]